MENEKRLCEIARFEVREGGCFAGQGQHDDGQHHRPKSEHDFDFAQKVPDAGVSRVCVCQVLKVLGAEGVQHGQRKNAGCHPGQD